MLSYPYVVWLEQEDIAKTPLTELLVKYIGSHTRLSLGKCRYSRMTHHQLVTIFYFCLFLKFVYNPIEQHCSNNSKLITCMFLISRNIQDHLTLNVNDASRTVQKQHGSSRRKIVIVITILVRIINNNIQQVNI